MTIGTEHEYSLSDIDYRPLPINDRIIQQINGSIVNEFPFGPVNLSKELQKHVIEIVPAVPAKDVVELEGMVYSGLQKLQAQLGPGIKMLGMGMHPLLELSQTEVWDHEDREIYEVYDRLFGIRQHGWLNIQALQMNLPFRNDDELVSIYNRIRALVPFLVAVSASSPYVEGKATGKIDNRLIYYRENQRKLPIIGHGIIPERLRLQAGLSGHPGEDVCRLEEGRRGHPLPRMGRFPRPDRALLAQLRGGQGAGRAGVRALGHGHHRVRPGADALRPPIGGGRGRAQGHAGEGDREGARPT